MCRTATTFALVLICSALLLSQEGSSSPKQLSAESAQDQLIRRVAPIYPPLARQARIQGTVVLKVVISTSGEVRDLQLVSGHPMLAPAAIEAVKQWRYKPYVEDGQAVDVETNVQVNFKLAVDKPLIRGVVGDMPGGLPPEKAQVGHVGVCEIMQTGAATKRVRVSQGVMQALLIAKPAPEYPADAKSQHIEGTALLDVEVGRDGLVCDVALISGHPLLAPAAIEAVRQWKYRPYLLNGEAVEVETQVQVNFTLAGG